MADQKFLDEVRNLIAKLKALAHKAAEELKSQNKTDTQSSSETDRSLDDASHAADQIGNQIAANAGQVGMSVYA